METRIRDGGDLLGALRSTCRGSLVLRCALQCVESLSLAHVVFGGYRGIAVVGVGEQWITRFDIILPMWLHCVGVVLLCIARRAAEGSWEGDYSQRE